jgi:hypothetical protein
MLHRGGPSLVVQGRLVLRRLGDGPLWRSACTHTLDQEVLSRLGTERLLRARPTVRAGPHDRDRQRWMGACNACKSESQSAWGVATAATY